MWTSLQGSVPIKNLEGTVAVVTGAASGVGRATAIRLARKGCSVALVDVNAGALEETASLVRKAGRSASTHVADVSSAERMAQLPSEVVEQHGACHILVNNAGVVTIGRFESETIEAIRWIVGINVWGVVHGCHYFLPVLREADEAHIVNVSSMGAFAALPRNAVYAMTKGAVRSFSEGLRADLKDTNIGVSTVFPGAIGTNILQNGRGEDVAKIARMHDTWYAPLMRSRPETAAAHIVSAIKRNRGRTLVGPDARALDLAGRIAPGRSGPLGRVFDRLAK